ncbi:MAG TPA: PAS domain S-box protein, partial [Thermoanaerobaculia bacterium]|nr:PAS domain S-box protein [Thermoanaerobaculia bacterium]
MTIHSISPPAGRPSRFLRAGQRLARFVSRGGSLSRDSLRTTVAILRAQQEATLDGILVVDTGGKVLSYNRRFLEIWRIPESVAATADDNELLGYAAEAVADWDAFIELVNYLYEHPDEVRTDDSVLLRDGRILSRASMPIIVSDEIRGRCWYFRDITESVKGEKLQAALFRISELSRTIESLDDFHAAVHRVVGELMDAKNFIIAEYDDERDLLTFPFFVDAFDARPESVRPGRGLTAWVLRNGKPLLATPEVFDRLVTAGEVEPIGTPSIDWIGAPLRTGDRNWGVIATQSYDESTRYSEKDLEILVFVAQQVASAIEHRRREDALRQSEIKFRQMFENNRAVKLVIDPASGEIVDANMAACEYYGYTRDELRAMRIWDINIRTPDQIRADMDLAARDEKTYFHFRHRRASGEIRDVEVHSGPIDVGGRRLLYSIIHDITERKRAEDSVAAASAQLRQQSAAIMASMDGTGILDERLAFTYANESLARLFGYPASDEVLGRSLCDLYEPHEQVRFLTNIIPLVQQRGRWRGEATGLRRDGVNFPQEISLTTLGGGGMVCVIRDITERTYAEEQIKHLAYHDALTNLPNRLLFKDRLTVALSHAHREGSRLAVLFLDLDR